MSGGDVRQIVAAGRIKKKARSRVNSDDEDESSSYARPTSVGSYDLTHSRRSQTSTSVPTTSTSSLSPDSLSLPHAPLSQPQTPFTTLSSVAMDELYTLERQEALRRAEYEARHAEALRRAELETRQQYQEREWERRERERDRYEEYYDFHGVRSAHYGGGSHHTRPRDQHHLRHNHPYLDSYSAHSLHSASHPHSMYTNPQPPSHSSSHSSLSSFESSSSFPYTVSPSPSTSTSTSPYPYSGAAGFRLSKSATTSPVGTPWEKHGERGYFGMSNERGDPSEDDDLNREFDDKESLVREPQHARDIKSKRRLSGPAWYMAPEDQDRDYPFTSSSVSTLKASASIASLPPDFRAASHPSQLQSQKRLSGYHRVKSQDNVYAHRESERHSPLSSDSEDGGDVVQMKRRKSYQDVVSAERLIQHEPLSAPHSPKRYRSNPAEFGSSNNTHPSHGNFHGSNTQHGPHLVSGGPMANTNTPAYTPSGSPFLGPMRGLNLHSTNPSRAPSPILMPPSAISSVRDEVVALSPSSSPPTSHRVTGPRNKSYNELSSLGGGGSSNHGRHPYRDSRGHHGAILHDWDRDAVSLNEPKEREYVRDYRERDRTNGGPTLAYPRPSTDLRSRDSSRAASPIGHGISAAAHNNHGTGHPSHPSQHHSHLAHSVRMAFGMTPIHPPPATAFHPSSNSHHSGSSFSSIASVTSPSTSVLGKLSLGSHPTSHSGHSRHTSPLHSPPLRPGSPPILSGGFGFGFTSRGPSRPTSRPGSPPITLAPLRLPASAVGDPSERNIPGIHEATDVDPRPQVISAKSIPTPVVDDVDMDNAQTEPTKEAAMQVDGAEPQLETTSREIDIDTSIGVTSFPIIHAHSSATTGVQVKSANANSNPPRVIQPAPGVNMDKSTTTTAQTLMAA
ncbi:hypothetical protein C8J55DRAFT_521048 [Lentinula edodes]|uniref:Uncharacterized protein n=1 Tax=Lentinula lateritia TaxID=40482 RepID=A0A9W9A0X5_9AGAR|nr:hypothetical protein C8J55DRAFT_521048 [Lentinula edodes]